MDITLLYLLIIMGILNTNLQEFSVKKSYNALPLSPTSSACSLSTKVFTNLLEPFHRVQLSDEEFVLIRAIIYSHMVTTGLSDQAQKLLMAEAQKYSAMLLRIQQVVYMIKIVKKHNPTIFF